jgi:hypothetical protein
MGFKHPIRFRPTCLDFPPPWSVIASRVSALPGLFMGDRPFPEGGPTSTFKEWCLRLFGEGISRHFMIPLQRKIVGRAGDGHDCRLVWELCPCSHLGGGGSGAHADPTVNGLVTTPRFFILARAVFKCWRKRSPSGFGTCGWVCRSNRWIGPVGGFGFLLANLFPTGGWFRLFPCRNS